MQITSFRELDNEAIIVGFATISVKPFYQKKKENGKQEVIACKEVSKFYGETKYYLGFFSGHAMKVVPKFSFFVELLEEAGYSKVDLIDIPFSVERSPLEVRRKWNQLVNYVEKEHKKTVEIACLNLAKKLQLASFENELGLCIEIPEQGVNLKVRTKYNVESYQTFRPITVFMKDGRTLLGRYNIENGICIFVYRNGHTYLTKSKEVQEKLQEGGYIRDYNMNVPLINGGEFMQPSLKYRWDNL